MIPAVPALPKARLSAALLLTAALALAISACGSGSSTTTAAPAASTPPATTTPSEASTPATSTPQSSTPSSSAPSTPSSSQTPENSIKDYGSAASSAEKAALASAAFSFFKAMAASDYQKICTDISASNRKEMAAFSKAKPKLNSCPAVLKTLIGTRGVPEAKKAAAGRLISVRVKGPTAFVIFAPKGGKPSYFVLKREAGAWKAISLAPGSPLNP